MKSQQAKRFYGIQMIAYDGTNHWVGDHNCNFYFASCTVKILSVNLISSLRYHIFGIERRLKDSNNKIMAYH